MKRLALALAAIGVALLTLAFAGATQAASCSAPIEGNEPLEWLSDTGVEVEWRVDVKSGCTARVRLVVFRDTTDPGNVKSAQVSSGSSPSYDFGAGWHTLNGLLPMDDPIGDYPADGDPGWAVLYVNGVVFRIIPVVPSDFA